MSGATAGVPLGWVARYPIASIGALLCILIVLLVALVGSLLALTMDEAPWLKFNKASGSESLKVTMTVPASSVSILATR